MSQSLLNIVDNLLGLILSKSNSSDIGKFRRNEIE